MTESLKEFFRGKKVLVTGHTGFKGGWLTMWLVECGSHVVGYALNPEIEPSLFRLCRLQEKVISYIDDIQHIGKLKEIFVEHRPEIVFHLAAQPLVRLSYRDPVETFSTNVMGTVNVLEACRETLSVKAIVNITSDKCYENREWEWSYRENDLLGGYDPYSSSKACAEIVTSAYRESFFRSKGVGIASVRAGNVIGGGDWARHRLVPDCLKALEEKKKILIRNPSSVRPWQHVLEPLRGYLMLAASLYKEPEKYSGPWNFGPEIYSGISVREIVENIINEWKEGDWEHIPSERVLHEAGMLKLDSTKAFTLLGWRPKWNIQTAVGKTIEWHKKYLSGANMYEICCNQIREYIEN
ncbi:MAG TPA: CDP-glucose 4,6-dehydratase [Dissulfurispiraceae bacterium]|nr:CDP-glucose 4,6-dehydratase [Dissulfurispiraceae bacterium]